MRTLLLLFAFASAALPAENAGTLTVREKLLARILESAPPTPPPPAPPPNAALNEVPAVLVRPIPTPRPPPGGNESVGPPVMMAPVIVSTSRLIREVTTAIAREEQDQREGKFSPLDGGKIVALGQFQIGGWWDPADGWTFLRFNNAPTPRTRRQAETAEARMKELQELLQIGEKPKR